MAPSSANLPLLNLLSLLLLTALLRPAACVGDQAGDTTSGTAVSATPAGSWPAEEVTSFPGFPLGSPGFPQSPGPDSSSEGPPTPLPLSASPLSSASPAQPPSPSPAQPPTSNCSAGTEGEGQGPTVQDQEVPGDVNSTEGEAGEVCSQEAPSPRPARLIDTGTLTAVESALAFQAASWLSLPLAALGVLLNALTAATYLQRNMRSPCSTFLVALSLAELLYLLLMFCPLLAGLVYGPGGTRRLLYIVSALYVSNFLLASLRRVAFLLTLVVSAERFLAVAWPLRAQRWRLLSRRSGPVSALVFLLTLLVHVPTALKHQVVALGGGQYTFRRSAWWSDNGEAMDAFAMVVRALWVYLPLFATLLLNVLTTLALRRHRRQSAHVKSTQDAGRTGKADLQMTLAILVSTLVFVLLSLPTHLMSIATNYTADLGVGKREHYLYLVLVRVFSALETLSNITDVLAYLALSQRFRLTFTRLLLLRCCCCCCCRRCRDGEEAGKMAGSAGSLRDTSAVVTGHSQVHSEVEMSTVTLADSRPA